MKFIVTGGAGFIGNNIVRNLVKKGHSVEIVDNMHTGKMKNLIGIKKDIKLHKIDIRDFQELEKILRNADGVFHEAALTAVQESYKKTKEYFDVNVKGTKNIFEIGKKHNFKVVYASSSSIYGNTVKVPIKENFSRNPINPYGETKLQDEFLAEKYSKFIDIIGLRYFNVYGKGQTNTYAGVITKFMNRLNSKKQPKIFGDGSQKRDFIFVEDVAEANVRIMLSKVKTGFFNIGTGKAISINHLAKVMLSLYGLEMTPMLLKPLEGDVKNSQANIDLLTKKINWKPKTQLKKGLGTLIRK
jgi:UDP-glucose 4-epimerase